MLRYRLAKVYWRVVRPRTLGVRAIVVDEGGAILLVRHTYQDGWYLPGGGVKRHESLIEALHRELREEVGVAPSATEVFGAYSAFAQGKRDHVVLYVVTAFTRVDVRHSEIAESRLFATGALPADVSPGTRRRIAEYAGEAQLDFTW